MTTVKFNNIGRYLKTWTCNMREVNEKNIIKQVKANGQVLSRIVLVDFSEDKKSGTIWVGDMRPIGTFEIVEKVKS